MAAIVLVHGIAQEQKSADVLEGEWLPALAGGVRNAGFDALADRLWRDRAGPTGIASRMAFYGDLFLRPGQQGAAVGDLDPEQAAFAERLAIEWLERAAVRASNEPKRREAAIELASVRPDPALAAQGPRAVARSTVQHLARVRWLAWMGMAVAERVFNRDLAQVTLYLTDEKIRQEAQRRVLDRIGPDTRVLVGHSLGSVVAFEVAHQLDHPLPLLVTLGSPLGLNTIVYERLRPQPPTFPPTVRRWVNVADRDDIVAAEPDLSARFAAGRADDAIFEGGFTVENGADPHSALFYLGKVETGQPIGQTLLGRYESSDWHN